jgi:hypothetical protein
MTKLMIIPFNPVNYESILWVVATMMWFKIMV